MKIKIKGNWAKCATVRYKDLEPGDVFAHQNDIENNDDGDAYVMMMMEKGMAVHVFDSGYDTPDGDQFKCKDYWNKHSKFYKLNMKKVTLRLVEDNR